MPRKPDYLTFYLARHSNPDWDYYLLINYRQSLENVLKMLKGRSDWLGEVPTTIYNRFGQEIPMSYQIPGNNLTFYLDRPSEEQLADLDQLLKLAGSASETVDDDNNNNDDDS